MLGGVVEDDAVAGVAQEGGAARLAGEDAGLALLAQVRGQARRLRDEAHQGLGLVGVEVVDDEVPARGGRVGRDDALDVGEEVGLGAGRAAGRGDDLAGGHVAAEDEGAGAVADVLELPPLDLARAAGGRPGCLRSSACTPVSSSVLTIRAPRAGQRRGGAVAPVHVGHHGVEGPRRRGGVSQ